MSAEMKGDGIEQFNSIYYQKLSPEDKPQKRCYENAGENKFFVCWEKIYSGTKKTNVYASYPTAKCFFEMYDQLEDEEKRFYEQIKNECIEHYDIDGEYTDPEFQDYKLPSGEYELDHYIRDFMEARRDFIEESKWDIPSQCTLLVKDSCNEEKNKVSLHLIVRSYKRTKDSMRVPCYFPSKLMCQRYMMEFKTYLEYDDLGFKFDSKIYTKNRNLRLLGSHKHGQPERPLKRSFYNRESVYMPQELFCASYIEPDSVPITCDILLQEPIVKDLEENKLNEVEQNTIEEVIMNDPYIGDNFTISCDEVGFYTLTRKQASKCPICDPEKGFKERIHDHENQYVTLYNGGIYLRCHRDTQNRKYFIGRYKASTTKFLQGKKKSPNEIEIPKKKKPLCYYPEKIRLDPSKCTEYKEHIKYVQEYNPKPKVPVYICEAQLGTGKTLQIICYTNKQGTMKRIIALSSRRSFARNFTGEINSDSLRKFKCYSDLKNEIDLQECQSLVIQVESLHRLDEDNKPHILIIDEIESILYQMTSRKTHKKNLINNYKMLKHLLLNAKHIFMLDGYISNRTMDFITSLRLDYEFHKYTMKPEEREMISIPKRSNFGSNLISTLKAGKKVYFYCASFAKLKDEFLPNILKELPNLRIKEYSKRCPPDDLDNIRETWQQYDLIVTTSVLTVGCNFDIGCKEGENPYFDQLFCYMNKDSKNLVRDVFQSLKRVRKINDKKLKFCLETSLYDQDSDFPLSRSGIIRQLQTKEEAFDSLFKQKHQQLDLELIELFIHNQLEANMSVILMEPMWYHYAKINGYHISPFNEVLTKFQWDKYQKVIPDYWAIEELRYSEFINLLSKQQRGETLKEKEELEQMKFLFQHGILQYQYVNDSIAEQYWERYFNHGRTQMINMTYEKGILEGTITMQELVNRGEVNIIEGADRVAQLGIMREMCLLLKMDHSQVTKIITREDMENTIHAMKHGLYSNMLLHFGLRDQRTKKESTITYEEIMRITSRVWNKWGTSKVRMGERKRKQIKGKRVEVTEVEFGDDIPDFMDRMETYKEDQFAPGRFATNEKFLT